MEYLALLEKLAVDFVGRSSLCARMDQDTIEPIVQQCTRAGMIMEDASVIALTFGPMGEAARSEALARPEKDSRRIDQLLGAARALASQ